MSRRAEDFFPRDLEDAAAEAPLRAHHRHFQRFLWVHYAVILIGAWLLVGPYSFGYRETALGWSDAASGLLLILFGYLSLSPHRLWAPWASFAVGAWLQFAPLVFWAAEPAAYVNDTFAGAAVIALTILIPDVPGAALFRKPGAEVPPGWSYNPSAWVQRMPLVVLAVAGWFVSRHMAAFHLGYIDWVWDPLFGEGTVRVLTSEVSEAFPVSDAGLGAVAYTFEALLAFMGLKDRWRTNPSTVLVFGLLVIPLGVTHLVLVTLMPVLVGFWCASCLLVAFLMLVMVPLALDEMVATLQFLSAKRKEGHSLGTLLVKGEGSAENRPDTRSPAPNAPLGETLPAMAWGVTLPWFLVVSALLGAWLMAAPGLLGTAGAAANSGFLSGALVITVSVLATAEVARACRFLNIPLGLWVALAPWMLSGGGSADSWNNALVGIFLIGLSVPRGPVRERYGSWDRFVF